MLLNGEKQKVEIVMNKSRLQYAVLNMGVSGMTTVLKMVLSFASRTIFIYILGSKFLGLNGLLTSILTTLSLAELGIGNAIIYSLYRPVADNNWPVVRSIMHLYRKIYRILAVIVFIIGLFLLPFLPHIVGKNIISNFELYYMILLINSSVSYLLTYNRSLIIANQRNYVVSVVDFSAYVFTVILQIFILFFFKSYTFYLIAQVVFTILGNVALTIYVHKEYGKYFVGIDFVNIPKGIIKKLKKNVIGTFANKVGDVIVNGTDSILIAMFISLSTVGLYSNYQLIILAVQSVLLSVSSAMTSSIGNFAAGDHSARGLELFYKHQFMNYSLTFFSSAFLIALLPLFISFWLGSDYLLSIDATVIMIVNFVVNRQRNSGNVFIEAYGLAYEQRLKPLLEAVVNLSLSVLFLVVFHLGILGILLATTVTSTFIATTYEAWVIFKYGFKQSVWKFYSRYLKLLSELGVNLLVVYYVSQFVANHFYSNKLLLLVVIFLLTVIISTGLYWFINFKKSEFRYVKNILVSRFRRNQK